VIYFKVWNAMSTHKHGQFDDAGSPDKQPPRQDSSDLPVGGRSSVDSAAGSCAKGPYSSGNRTGFDHPASLEDFADELSDFDDQLPDTLSDTIDSSSTVDELVVYLDGQMDGEQRKQIERLLLDDEEARDRLSKLQQSWDALDVLPMPACTQSFTESTVKLVVQRELQQQRQSKPWRRIWRPFAGGAAIMVSLAVGFIGTRFVLTAEDRQFLESYDLIENWEKYESVGEFEYLLRLDKDALFAQELQNDAE